jgi:hypothetical protein
MLSVASRLAIILVKYLCDDRYRFRRNEKNERLKIGIYFAFMFKHLESKGRKMNVDFLIKTNPFNIPGVQIPKPQDNAQKQATTAQVDQAVQSKPASGANFVQKIKETNDAVGFIQISEMFISKLDKEGITSFEAASALGATISYSQKNVLSKQSFDTTAGVIQIDLSSSEIGFGGDFEEWKKNAKEMLKSKKEQISNPLAAFGVQKKEQMDNAAQKISVTTETNTKLGSLLDNINESLNRFEQK